MKKVAPIIQVFTSSSLDCLFSLSSFSFGEFGKISENVSALQNNFLINNTE